MNKENVYAVNIQEDGTLSDIYVLATLHLDTDKETANRVEIGNEGFLVAQKNGKVYKRKLCNKKRIEYDTLAEPTCC